MCAVFLLAQPEGGGQVEQIARTFGVDWPHLLAQTISFSIVCALLYWLAYKPILRMLDQRRAQIAQGLANAEKIKAELAKTEAQRHDVLAAAHGEARALIEEARAAAARVQAEETGKAVTAAQEIIAGAHEAAAQERVQLLAALRHDMGRLVLQTTATRDRQGPHGRGSAAPRRRDRASTVDRILIGPGAESNTMKPSRRRARVARQLYRLCLVQGVLDEARVHVVVDGVIRAGRRGSVDILSGFRRLVRLDRQRHTALVVSAAPLPDDLRADVAARVERLYGRDIETSFSDDPALIGGMRLTVGSDVYDGSVRARLAAIAARL